MRRVLLACLSVCLAGPVAAQTSAPAPQAAAAASFPDARAEAYYQFLLGRHYEADGEIDKAIAAHREAARLDPSAASIRAELAGLFARQRRLDEAATEARAALSLDPNDREANRILGGILASSIDLAGGGPVPPEVREAIVCLERGRRADGIDFDPTLDLTLARLYLRNGDNDKAVSTLQRIVEREPIAEAYLLLAQAQQASGHPADAAKALELGAEQNPRLYATLGEYYDGQQQWRQAADAYGNALKIVPQSGELKTRLATSLLNDGSDDSLRRASALLRDLVSAEPGNNRALYLLSQSDRRLHEYTAAEASAKRVLANDASSLWGAFALAQVFEDRREYRKVIDTLDPAMRGWSSSSDMPARQAAVVLAHLGFSQLQMGETDNAIATFTRARSIGQDAAYDMYLAQAYLAARRYDEARKTLEPLRARQPTDVRFAQLEARVLAEAGQREQAVTLMQKIVAANPGDSSGWLSLADMLSKAERTGEALKVLDEAASKFPSDVTVPFQRGALLERAKDFPRAEAAFRDVIARDPRNAPALNYLGYMFAERGERLDEAVDLIERALQIDPNNGSYLDSLGWAYFRQNKLTEARESLSKAAEQLPANSVVQDHYGDVLRALGDTRGAVDAWQRALDGDRDSLDVASTERKIRDTRERASR